MTISRNEACQRLSSLGLRQDVVHKIIDQVDTWARKSGKEWTVSRLKALKNDYVRRMGNKDERSPWIAYRADGSPKGNIGLLFRLKGKKSHVKALNALMAYSAFVSEEITPKQWKKFHSSVVESPTVTPHGKLLEMAIAHRVGIWKGSSPTPITLDQVTYGNTNVPNYEGKRLKEFQITQWLPGVAKDGVSRRLSQRYPAAFEGMKPDLQQFWSAMPNWDVTPVVGRIGFIQEPGYKLRAVANPDRIVQFALEPLRKEIARWLKKTCPEDCTFDQEAGVRVVSQWLAEGKTVHSVDLSDATNNFPFDLQLSILRKGMSGRWKPWIDLFEEVSRAKWSVRGPDRSLTTIEWTKGQPLGLGPSFVSFALAHNHLVSLLKERHGGDFRILGDDIVIIGDSLAQHYRSALTDLGCPISADKSISSNRVAEFAGKIIQGDGIIQPYKWRGVSDRNFLDLARSIGPSSIGMLQPRQKAITKLLSEVPEEYGGLGWNPKGKPYEVRVQENLDIIRKLESANDAPYGTSNSELNRLRLRNLRQGSLSDLLDKTKSARAPESSRLSGERDTRTRVILDAGVTEEKFRQT